MKTPNLHIRRNCSIRPSRGWQIYCSCGNCHAYACQLCGGVSNAKLKSLPTDCPRMLMDASATANVDMAEVDFTTELGWHNTPVPVDPVFNFGATPPAYELSRMLFEAHAGFSNKASLLDPVAAIQVGLFRKHVNRKGVPSDTELALKIYGYQQKMRRGLSADVGDRLGLMLVFAGHLLINNRMFIEPCMFNNPQSSARSLAGVISGDTRKPEYREELFFALQAMLVESAAFIYEEDEREDALLKHYTEVGTALLLFNSGV